MATRKKKPASARKKATAPKKGASTSASARGKTAAKKAAAKKTGVQKTAAKKIAGNKTARQTAAKKTAPKKTAVKKTAAKAAKKAAAGKTAAKKTTGKSTATKKATVKKTAAKKTATRKTAVKKAAAGKSAPNKTASTRAPAKKTAAKKAAATPQKKAAARKAAAPKKAATGKSARQSPSKTNTAIMRKDSDARARARGQEGTLIHGLSPYHPGEGEAFMNEAQKEHFRAILDAWRHELMEEADRTMHHLQDEAHNLPDPADRATQEEEFALELRTRDRERKLLKKIEKAVDKIDHDEYGYCEACGIEIGIRRLEARPTAELCIDCKELAEIKEKQIAG